MSISKSIKKTLTESSWIRKMFEQGAQLKAQYGAENVFDFSLGNPNIAPPKEFSDALFQTTKQSGANHHAYMPNNGIFSTRNAIAITLSKEQQINIPENNIVMTCGAAGALNVVFKTILDPEDEIITTRPFFAEYRFYATNHQGTLKTVATKPDFSLDIEQIEAAISPKTKAILINSPNNPTGQVYSEDSLKNLGDLLTLKSKKFNQIIYLISDEPYRKIVYDDTTVPAVFHYYPETIIAMSYSKELSIPGERIGYLAVHPDAAYKSELLAGMSLANRILGFVNAPAFMQRVIEKLQDIYIDPKAYQRKRDLLCDGLRDYGYEFVMPKGAFYVFPKSPIEDDVAFVRALQEHKVLVVPGGGFGCPGFFRIAYCVDDETIIKALPQFGTVLKQL